MCLAIPGKIVKIDKEKEYASVDYGDGTKRQANISLVEANVGDYVLVHAGFAIQVLDEKEALADGDYNAEEANETLELFREILSAGEEV